MWTRITEDKATWPPDGERVVLLCDLEGHVYAGVCNFSPGAPMTSWVFDPDDGSLIYIGAAATHWMPLPQPPTE